MTKTNFDMDVDLKLLREGKSLTGKDGILIPLIKQLTEVSMQAELEEHLSNKEQSNRKNGRCQNSQESLRQL